MTTAPDRAPGPMFSTSGEDLEPMAECSLEPSQGRRGARGGAAAEPTVVTIGRARREHLAPVPNAEEQYQVLQLACTFLPARGAEIDWVRFRVELKADDQDLPDPIAVDLFPLEVHEAGELELGIKLAPRIGFGPFSLELGSLSTNVQRVRQWPVLTAGGLQSNVFYWQLERSPQHPIIGTRTFYALVAVMPPLTRYVLTSSVAADITARGRTFRGTTRTHHDKVPIRQVL